MKGDIRSLDHLPQKFGQARGMVRDPAEFTRGRLERVLHCFFPSIQSHDNLLWGLRGVVRAFLVTLVEVQGLKDIEAITLELFKVLR